MAPLSGFEEKQLGGMPILSADPPPDVQEHLPASAEKGGKASLDGKEAYSDSEKSSQLDLDDASVVRLKGEPVVTTGKDVSRYVVDIRDDGGEALTFRSFILGTVFAGLGAALCQIYLFKPVQMTVSSVFLLLLIYTAGNAWATFLPRSTWVTGTRFGFLSGVFHFINPGPFTLKEHVVSSLVASTAAGGSTAVMNFAVQRLFYDTHVGAATAVLATFSTACFGYGLVGLLRPLTVYPSEMVYWFNLPTVSVFQALHFDTSANKKRLRVFWLSFTGMFVYEVIPSYIFPLLNGFNIFCLASQHAPQRTRDVFTNLFGGSDGNEGLGFLSLSFDWQYIGSTFMSLPLIQQANSWIGYALCYIILMVIYYSNAWGAQSFPMLSSSIFSSNGSRYQQRAVFGTTFTLNETALEEVGLPSLTGSDVYANLTANLAIGGLIAHCIFFWGSYARDSFISARNGTQADPHYQPFSTLLFARMGNGIATNQLMKMVAGAVNPGRPVANLYFSMWSHDVVSTSISLAGDLKMGQYLKIPPRVMFLTQVWGTILGAAINYAVMTSVVDAQREILLDPTGTNVWSGQVPQSLNSAAVTWSLAKQLYSFNGPYWIVPMSLLIGMVPTIIQWFIARRWPRIGPIQVDNVMLPIIYMVSIQPSRPVSSLAWFRNSGSEGITQAGIGSTTISWVVRSLINFEGLDVDRCYPSGALDGGAQIMIFILSFAVFGASGASRPFPTWAGNPARGNVDYCNGNGALDD
ncbi:hypothetical protein EYR38_002325 [Pleurotus pulmonarius]|nr:hypothetical protein EYR38_002325 [Pleurotus pulmonarius]